MVLRRKDALKHVIYTLQLSGVETTECNLQNIVYILKEMDIPVFYHYNVYLYGPYSDELNEDLRDMFLWGELDKEHNHYRVNLSNMPEIDMEFMEKIQSCLATLIDIASGDTSGESFDLIAMILYSVRAFESFDIPLTTENMVNEIKKWRGDRFSKNDIKLVFNKVTDKLLVKNKVA